MEDGIFFGGNHGKQKKQWFIIIVPDVFLDPPNLKHAKIWGQSKPFPNTAMGSTMVPALRHGRVIPSWTIQHVIMEWIEWSSILVILRKLSL